ncbi:MAG: hypothetical protein EXR18_05530 [Flavobacteriaceae bacterium]|nr:hypothetical protein [Flavobacteriaceae bacterium]
MKNIFFTLFCILFIVNVGNSQNNKISKTIADRTTKLPLENVRIFNEIDNSITNQEGAFVFFSNKKEINFDLLGYNSLKSTFEEIEKKDTIFMEVKVFELKEIVIPNLELFVKKVYDKIGENNISNNTSNFFLRNVLKKDDDIIILQDIYGKREKNVSLKNPIEIEVSNMRKTSLFQKKNLIDFTFPNFNDLFEVIIPSIDKCIFTEVEYYEVDYKKILFETKEKSTWGQTLRGYFIINKKDYAIVEIFESMYDNPEVAPYNKIIFSDTQYRTVKFEKFLRFSKNNALNKYYVSILKLNAQMEVLADKRIEKTFFFNLAMDYFTSSVTTNEKVKSNFAVDKDIFKAKFPYSADFWNNQNQLPLTNELKDFLKLVSENKDKKKEFEIIGNF